MIEDKILICGCNLLSGDNYRFDEIQAKAPLGTGADFIPPVFSPLAMMSMMKVSEADDTTKSVTNYMDKITDRMLGQTVKHLHFHLLGGKKLGVTMA